MANTWENVNCTFETLNTVNNLGNSQYTITGNPNRMVRYAPINRFRAPTQVNFDELKSLCYLQHGCLTEQEIMKEADDNNITIFSVVANTIVFSIPGKNLIATRIPATGWTVFDCINNDGILSHIHVGHALSNLRLT